MTIGFTLLIILIALSFVLNSLVIIINAFSWSDLSNKDHIIISLAIADLLQTIIAYPYLLTDYDLSTNDEPTPQCVMSAFIATITVITSIAHFVAFFLKFYIAIEFPFKTEELEKRWFGGLIFIIPCWIYGVVWAIFPIFGWSSYGKETDTGYRCGLNFRTHTANVISYNIALVIASFIIPITIALICNTRIVRAYRRLKNQAAMNLQMEQDTLEQLHKIYFVSIIMFVAFALAWSPYAALVVLNIFGIQPKQNFLDAAAIIAKTSAACNPIIYALVYKEFRMRAHRMFAKLRKQPNLEAIESVPKLQNSSRNPIDEINQSVSSLNASNQSSIIIDSIDQQQSTNIIHTDNNSQSRLPSATYIRAKPVIIQTKEITIIPKVDV